MPSRCGRRTTYPTSRSVRAGLLRCAHVRTGMAAVEIARQQTGGDARGAAHLLEIGFGGAREVIVDDDGRDRGDEADRGRQQGFGDAGRYDREVGGLRLRDADETVHDAPDRAEQAYEGRGRANGRK